MVLAHFDVNVILVGAVLQRLPSNSVLRFCWCSVVNGRRRRVHIIARRAHVLVVRLYCVVAEPARDELGAPVDL